MRVAVHGERMFRSPEGRLEGPLDDELLPAADVEPGVRVSERVRRPAVLLSAAAGGAAGGCCDAFAWRRPGRWRRHVIRHGHGLVADRRRISDAASATQSAFPEQGTQVSPVLLGEEGVQHGVRARIQRVEADQEDLSPRHPNQRSASKSRQPEEGDGGEAGEVGENEQRHSFGDGGVRRTASATAPSHSAIDTRVARAHEHEGQGIRHQQRHQVRRVGGVAVFHGKTNTATISVEINKTAINKA